MGERMDFGCLKGFFWQFKGVLMGFGEFGWIWGRFRDGFGVFWDISRTLEEGSEVVEGSVLGAAVPARQGQAVVGLQPERVPAPIHHHHPRRVPVQARDILRGDPKTWEFSPKTGLGAGGDPGDPEP